MTCSCLAVSLRAVQQCARARSGKAPPFRLSKQPIQFCSAVVDTSNKALISRYDLSACSILTARSAVVIGLGTQSSGISFHHARNHTMHAYMCKYLYAD
jgi:hypothetical protein